MKRIFLRLDDGSIIGHSLLRENGPPVKISFAKACEMNRGGEKDVERLKMLLAKAQMLSKLEVSLLVVLLSPLR